MKLNLKKKRRNKEATAKDYKVRFHLRNVHIAVVKDSAIDGSRLFEYGRPEPIPGRFTLEISRQGETNCFLIENTVVNLSGLTNGYFGRIVAEDPSRALAKIAFSRKKKIALLFQVQDDCTKAKYVMYNCDLGIDFKTILSLMPLKSCSCTDVPVSITPRTDSFLMCNTTSKTDAEVKKHWFEHVYEPI